MASEQKNNMIGIGADGQPENAFIYSSADDFESHFEASMNDLETIDGTTHRTDSESDTAAPPPNSESIRLKQQQQQRKAKEDNGLDSASSSPPSQTATARQRTTSSSSTDSSSDDNQTSMGGGAGDDGFGNDPFRSPEAIKANMLWQPFLIPFQDRRRLSQCKEEEDEDDAAAIAAAANKPKSSHGVTNAAAAVQTAINDEKPAKVPATKHKFIVTKAADEQQQQQHPKHIPREEVDRLKSMTPKQNAATIHFPCSSTQQRTALSSVFFSPQKEFSPHMAKRFFDTSLVEIRSKPSANNNNNATTTTNNRRSTNSLPAPSDSLMDTNVWIPMASSSSAKGSSVSFGFLASSRKKLYLQDI